jgi:menaquinone-dependent protoporphyrinogen oxidase
MNVLIAYASKYGAVQRVSEALSQRLEVPTTMVNLRVSSPPELSPYDTVIVGGSIYAGRILPSVPRFVERHREELLSKRVILFVSCLYEGEKGLEQLREAFPAWLQVHAQGAHNVGGEIILGKLRFLDRLIIRKFVKIEESVRRIDEGAIDRLAADIAP